MEVGHQVPTNMASPREALVAEVLGVIDKLTSTPERYLQAQPVAYGQLKGVLKNFYDNIGHNGRALDELVVQDFDDEQVWQELELQNTPFLGEGLRGVSRLLTRSRALTPAVPSEPVGSDHDSVSDDGPCRRDGPRLSDSEDNVRRREPGRGSHGSEKDGGIPRAGVHTGSKGRRTVVDDRFFKLAEMEKFLDREDRRTGDSDSEVGESGDDDEVGEDGDRTVGLKYDDFFDPPGLTGVSEGTEDEETDDENIDLEDDCTEYDTADLKTVRVSGRKADLLEYSDSEGDITSQKSKFELRKDKLKKVIAELEEGNLKEKSWQMKGEAAASDRPENSMLEEHLQFDHTARMAPVITEETTQTLEETIRQRIKDKAWDDVERKDKQSATPYEYRKRITLDGEKSKVSLGEVYEREYLQQQQQESEEKKDPDHEEIEKSMTSLFLKLDALSNFSYTPTPLAPEVKIINNMPSIRMEEVAPVGTSEAAALAPEEIQEKPAGEVKGQTERSETDKKRARRVKKISQRKKQQRSLARASASVDPGRKQNKEKLLKDFGKDNRVTVIKEGQKSRPSSSTAFFTQLQDEVNKHIDKTKVTKSNKTKRKVTGSAQLKL